MTAPPSSDAPQVVVFTDGEDRGWEVRAIRDPILPERRARFMSPTYLHGWLLFTSGVERRRYAPLPDTWSTASQAQLREWCASATLVVATQPRDSR